MVLNISAKELKKRLLANKRIILLDVRTKEERDIAVIEPSTWIPVNELEQRFDELDKQKEIIVYCHHGVRSEFAAKFLCEKGFKATSLAGGIDKWSEEIDETVKRY